MKRTSQSSSNCMIRRKKEEKRVRREKGMKGEGGGDIIDKAVRLNHFDLKIWGSIPKD